MIEKRVASLFAYPSSTEALETFHFKGAKSFPRLIGFKIQKRPSNSLSLSLSLSLSHTLIKQHKKERTYK
jgi:hypothetical protein